MRNTISARIGKLAIALILSVAGWSAPATAQERLFGPTEVRADFAALYTGLKEAQFDLYAHTSKAVLDRAYRAELGAFNRSMSLFEIQTRFQKFVAKIGVAHTRIEFPSTAYSEYLGKGGRAFSVEVRVDRGRVFVIGNKTGHAEPEPGDEITRLNGRPMSDWLRRLSGHVSADTPYLAHSIVEYRLPGLLWLELGPVEAFDVAVRKPDGRARDIRLPARTRAEQQATAKQQPKPFSLDDQRSARMLGGGIAYLRPGPFYNDEPGANMWDNAKFKTFVDGAFEGFIQAKAKSLIIDVRNNPGGDGAFSDVMVAWFANRPFRFVSDFRIKVSRQTIESNRKRLEQAKTAGVADSISPKFAALYAKAPPGVSLSHECGSGTRYCSHGKARLWSGLGGASGLRPVRASGGQ